MTCTCRGKGLVVVRYEDGTPFDLGVCRCPHGQWIRRRGRSALGMYAVAYGIEPHRVQFIEDLAEEAEMLALGLVPSAPLEDFTQAGKVGGKKARL